jgi:hypothetical protein
MKFSTFTHYLLEVQNKKSVGKIHSFLGSATNFLKVPKCEIFHLFDFNDFYGVNSL